MPALRRTAPWTAARLPSMAGTRIAITGATGGIGLATAQGATAAGAQVVATARDADAAAGVAQLLGHGAESAHLDLTDRDSIQRFADGVGELDVLIHNAGAIPGPRVMTGDGFESSMATHVLGPFVLTNLLADRIRQRVVAVCSVAHWFGGIDLDDLHFRSRRYTAAAAYAQSKLGVALWMSELDRRLRAAGSPVAATMAHPGWAATPMTDLTPSAGINHMIHVIGTTIANTATRGAACSLYAAGMPIPSGSYVGPAGLLGLRGAPTLVGRSSIASDPVLAGLFWERIAAETDSDLA